MSVQEERLTCACAKLCVCIHVCIGLCFSFLVLDISIGSSVLNTLYFNCAFESLTFNSSSISSFDGIIYLNLDKIILY